MTLLPYTCLCGFDLGDTPTPLQCPRCLAQITSAGQGRCSDDSATVLVVTHHSPDAHPVLLLYLRSFSVAFDWVRRQTPKEWGDGYFSIRAEEVLDESTVSKFPAQCGQSVYFWPGAATPLSSPPGAWRSPSRGAIARII